MAEIATVFIDKGSSANGAVVWS